MFKSKATEILRALGPNEIKDVKLLVRSPIYNKNKNIIKLFEALKPFYPDFTDLKCTKELLYKKVYGNKTYNDKIMRNLMSEFYKLLEDFIAFQSSRMPYFNEMLLFEKLYNFDNVFLKRYSDTSDSLKYSKFNNYYFHKKIFLLRSKINYFLDRNKQSKITTDALHLGEYQIFDSLSWLSENISNIQANEKSFNIDYGIKISEQFFKHFDYSGFIKSIDGKHPDIDFIKMNYHEFMLFYAEHPEDIYHSREIKKYLMANYKKYDNDYLFEVFTQLDNFYVKKTDLGFEDEILMDKFDIYKLRTQLTTLSTDRYWLRFYLYRSIIITALGLNEIEWAENFINSNIDRVHPNEKDFLFNYGKALIAFKKKEFKDVISICGTLSQDKPEIKFLVKWLIFCTYYELGYTEQFFFHSDTFRKYIDYANDIIPSRKENYKKVIRMGNKLMKLKDIGDPDKESIYLLKKEIEKYSEGDLTAKRWLLEKIDELEK